jgi:hypothetical protein
MTDTGIRLRNADDIPIYAKASDEGYLLTAQGHDCCPVLLKEEFK